MAYYHSEGAAKNLTNKFNRIKAIEERIARLMEEKRHCEQERREEIDKQLVLERDTLRAVKSVIV